MFEKLLVWGGLIIASYLIGSISSAILICKLCRLEDPRSKGSKNPGTTNVLRIGGKLPALLTLIGDAAKGAIPVYFSMVWQQNMQLTLACFLAAFLGHLYPIFFSFKGGKGVATLIGGLFALDWILGFAFVSTWLFIVLLFRISSLGAILAAIALPFYCYYFWGELQSVSFIIIMTWFLLYRHKANIVRLIKGQEPKIGKI